MKKYLILFTLLLTACAGIKDNEEPYITNWVEPIYPPSLAENCIEGYAVGSLSISSDGKVEQVKIVESFPKDVFNETATAAWLKMTYHPKVENGVALPVEEKLIAAGFYSDEPCADPQSVDLSEIDESDRKNIDPSKFGDAIIVVRAKILERERYKGNLAFADKIQILKVYKNE